MKRVLPQPVGPLRRTGRTVGVGRGEDLDLVPDGLVVRLVPDEIVLGLDDFEGMAHGGSPKDGANRGVIVQPPLPNPTPPGGRGEESQRLAM
jgi:hypothetical protein